MADWGSMTDKELADFTEDKANIEAETPGERDKLQMELCKRFGWKWDDPTGANVYTPPDWPKGTP